MSDFDDIAEDDSSYYETLAVRRRKYANEVHAGVPWLQKICMQVSQ